MAKKGKAVLMALCKCLKKNKEFLYNFLLLFWLLCVTFWLYDSMI